MTDFSDLPRVNQLYAELQSVTQAVSNIDNGATVTMLTVGMPPVPPYVPPDPGEPMPPPVPVMQMPVQLNLTEPLSQTAMKAIRDLLVARGGDIAAELADLGVTATPPAVA